MDHHRNQITSSSNSPYTSSSNSPYTSSSNSPYTSSSNSPYTSSSNSPYTSSSNSPYTSSSNSPNSSSTNSPNSSSTNSPNSSSTNSPNSSSTNSPNSSSTNSPNSSSTNSPYKHRSLLLLEWNILTPATKLLPPNHSFNIAQLPLGSGTDAHRLGRLVSESAFEREDPGSNPAADMVDAARNTAWDLGKQPNNYRSNYPTQEWARRTRGSNCPPILGRVPPRVETPLSLSATALGLLSCFARDLL
ncbi:hypothetical protein FHG87_008447 [Trinorchestia longiramus]|nr:hypothetical protein FHG87_008447 [Trinorchestia longiramus]